MTPFIQGAIAAATTACIYRQITQAKEKQPTWENITLAANHLFIVVNALLRENSVKSPAFTSCARAVFYLTPVALAWSFYANRKITRREKSVSTYITQFYYLVAAVSLAFIGNKEFRIAAFSILALDAAVHRKQCPQILRKVFTVFCQIAALATFMHYWKKLTTVERQSTMMVIGLAVLGPKIVAMLPEEDTSEGGEIRGKVRYSGADRRFLKENAHYCHYNPHHCYPPVYYGGGISDSHASQPRREKATFNIDACFLSNPVED
ncbi:MAG: hypothetical protein JSS10_07330 [Verrucomicrobia bacterium]|nr:hypothetical protein [Verrucomicrobiota bacterium]